MHVGAVQTIIAILVAGVAFLATNSVSLDPRLVTSIRAAGILWPIVFLILNYDHPRDRKVIIRLFRRNDPVGLYSWVIEGLLATLTRMMAPKTAVEDPPPPGRLVRLWWYTTPRAIDDDDRDRMKPNAWSWPVADAALNWRSSTPFSCCFCNGV